MRALSSPNRPLLTLVYAGLMLASVACSVNPATGNRQISFYSEEAEIQLGQQEDEKIQAAMGIYGDPEVQAYVDAIGQRLAAVSERPELPWTFRVIDDSAINAFALPGGFVYVTRGIMTHLNSEAELAGVMGHEIGHVTARHSVNQMSKQQLFGGLLMAGMIASPELRSVGDLAQSGLMLSFLKFSRDDERQADELGIRYMVQEEFDPNELPKVFAMLGAASGDSQRIPGWQSTHPDPGSRVSHTRARVAQMDEDFASFTVGRADYLRRLDGMTFGANPREGFFEGSHFLHPEMEFQIHFPKEWQTSNQRQQVVAINPEKNALIQLALAEGASANDASRKFFSQEGIAVGAAYSSRKVNGLPAAGGGFAAMAGETELRGFVIFVEHQGATIRLLGYGPGASWPNNLTAVLESLTSFGRLTDKKALAVQPARIQIVDLDQNLSQEEFQKRYPSTADPETVALVNQLGTTDSLQAGESYKRVVGGVQR